MKTLLFFLALAATVQASIVEVVNHSTSALRFTATGTVESVDALVLPNASRKWVVPEPVTYTVESVTGGVATPLGSLAVAADRVYYAMHDGAFVVSDRSYDASQVYGRTGYSTTDLAGWVKFGMVSQFAVEIAALCFMALRISRKAAIGHLAGENV